MPVETTSIAGLYLVQWPVLRDDRGQFQQAWQRSELAQALGHAPEFAQQNHARSRPGVLRGFHAEDWGKLIGVTRGTVFAAVADVREGSPTFGATETFLLGDPPGEYVRLYLAPGLANAYCVVSDEDADYVYDVTQPWPPREGQRRFIAWDDPTLAVDWPIDDPILSPEDRDARPL